MISDKVILFMSDGKPTDTEDEILNKISEQNAKLNNEVKIQTFGIGKSASMWCNALMLLFLKYILIDYL